MLTIKSSNIKLSQIDWMDEIQDVDWGGDPDPRGVVNEDNLSDYLVDDVEQTPEPPQQPDQPRVVKPPEGQQEPAMPTDFEEALGLPTAPPPLPEGVKQIPYQNARRLIYTGMDKAEVVGFEYTNRHGMYAGWRTVEPHYTFIAQTTGNEVLVTYDLSPNVNGIRAFIVGNIHPYGVRYKGYDFTPRAEIMRGAL